MCQNTDKAVLKISKITHLLHSEQVASSLKPEKLLLFCIFIIKNNQLKNILIKGEYQHEKFHKILTLKTSQISRCKNQIAHLKIHSRCLKV